MEEDLVLKTQYWDDPVARAAFKVFLRKIHGVDFSEWEAAGCWDEAYTPFSFFHDGTVVSSVCIYMLDAVVNGKPIRLAQLSGVGTLEQWRHKGLCRRLTDIGLEWAARRHDGVFLFANTEAVSFYQRCGFSPLTEYVHTVEAVRTVRRPGIVKLDPGCSGDLCKIYEYAKRRSAVSDVFNLSSAKLLVFHALHRLRDHAYEIPDLGIVVFFERSMGGRLTIFDVVGENVPALREFYPYIAEESDRIIGFHFHTDKMEVGEFEAVPLVGNNPFVKGDFPVRDPVFPFTAKA